jgi:MAP/microtubule affinity-regulating kinase
MEGDVVGTYVLGRSLGEGAFAVVREGRCAQSGRPVAVKVIERSKLSEKQQARLSEEISVLAALAHKNITKIYEVMDDGLRVYIVMKRAKGRARCGIVYHDLLDYLNSGGALTEPEAARIIAQLIDAVDYAHKRGFVHRDIKLENILLNGDRSVLLADWGFAGRWNPAQMLDEPLGSTRYCAPEIIMGEPYVGPEVDVWSIGVVLFALVSGRLPFTGDGAVLESNVVNARFVLPPAASPELKHLLSKILVPNRMERLSVTGIKSHPWIRKFVQNTPVRCATQ